MLLGPFFLLVLICQNNAKLELEAVLLENCFSLNPNARCVSVSFGLNHSNKLHISAPRTKRILPFNLHTDDDGSGSTGLSSEGFILGGLIVGALGCVYAPQKTRKVLAEKIAQLNSAIDDVSSQLNQKILRMVQL
ncbi:putative thylakoid membrane protein Ssl2009 [Arabidopsis thaliana]